MSANAFGQQNGSPVSTRRLWYSVLAAPIVWTVQGVVGWYLGSGVCPGGVPTAPSTGIVIIETVVGVVALAIAVIGVVIGYHDWQRTGEAPRLDTADGRTRWQYAAAIGTLVSAIFAISIVWAGLGVFLVDPCARMR